MNPLLHIIEVDGLFICGCEQLPTVGFGRTAEQAYDDFVTERRAAIAGANMQRELAEHPFTSIH